MPKPLELVVFDISDNPHLAAKANRHSATARAKRLTDAELAAEYWSAAAIVERCARGESCFELLARKELETWERFAKTPHFREEAADG